MKEDWIEQLRRKLDNYEVEPPPGLWEDICKQMGLEPEPASKKVLISRWWWAAAAVVLALVGFFVFNNPRSEQPLQANAVSQKQAPEQLSGEEPSSEQTLAQLSSSQQSPKAIIFHHHISNPIIPEPAEEQEPITSEENPSYTEPSETSQQEEPAKTQVQSQDDRSLIQTVHQYQTSQDSPKTSASPNKWSVGLMASGGLLAANNSQRTEGVYYSQSIMGSVYDLSYMYNYNSVESCYAYTLIEYASKHHLPLRVKQCNK